MPSIGHTPITPVAPQPVMIMHRSYPFGYCLLVAGLSRNYLEVLQIVSFAHPRTRARNLPSRQPYAAILQELESGVPGDLPGEAVGVGEVSGIAAPERPLAGLEDPGAGLAG